MITSTDEQNPDFASNDFGLQSPMVVETRRLIGVGQQLAIAAVMQGDRLPRGQSCEVTQERRIGAGLLDGVTSYSAAFSGSSGAAGSSTWPVSEASALPGTMSVWCLGPLSAWFRPGPCAITRALTCSAWL
jgi:hypothetical protein